MSATQAPVMAGVRQVQNNTLRRACWVGGCRKKVAQLSQMKSLVLFLSKRRNEAKEKQQDRKKIESAQLRWSIKKDCPIKAFEASTFILINNFRLSKSNKIAL